MLPDKVKRRLVLENCERCFSIKDCLDVSREIGIPVVFDTHHFECYKLLHPDEEFLPAGDYIPDILKSWSDRGIKPKFHVSEQGSGRCGHHSDYIEVIPHYLMEIPEKYGINIDIMIEAKMKEQSIFKLYEKYPFLNCKNVDTKKMLDYAPPFAWVKKHSFDCLCCNPPPPQPTPTVSTKKKYKLKIVETLEN